MSESKHDASGVMLLKFRKTVQLLLYPVAYKVVKRSVLFVSAEAVNRCSFLLYLSELVVGCDGDWEVQFPRHASVKEAACVSLAGLTRAWGLLKRACDVDWMC